MTIGQRNQWIGWLCWRPLVFVPIEQAVVFFRNVITVRRGLTAFPFWVVWIATAKEPSSGRSGFEQHPIGAAIGRAVCDAMDR